MRSALAVALETLVVAVLGLFLALTANALSPRGLRLNRDYFPEPKEPAKTAPPATHQSASVSGTNASPAPNFPVANHTLERLQQRGLQLVTSNQVVSLFRDPRREQELIVFIDARDETPYAAGHIPGAWPFHHYRPEKYLPTILPVCLTALQVIVYCTGGECEDSEFAALMLRDAGVPRDNIFVYPGGITEWKANALPIETGGRHSGQFLKTGP